MLAISLSEVSLKLPYSCDENVRRRCFGNLVRRFHRNYIATSERRWIATLQQRCNNVNWLNIFKNKYDCKCLFQRNTIPLKMQDCCMWPSEIMTVPPKYMDASAPLKLQYVLNRNIGQMHFICTIHCSNSSSKINIVSIKEWMVATTFVKYRNNVLWKKTFIYD